ncbi:MAG: hemerythrin domain-containing protein [Deltaproteobacteria bacterium]|nr:hemerythrin domain-containing protein [Deltaproteobacteria bacterium]
MRYASEDLMNEHEGILFGLKILEKMAEPLRGNKEVTVGDFQEMVNFLKLFADKCHHGKEEGLLFPAMERAGIQKEGGPIGQMLLEHAIGRKYIAEMTDSLEDDRIDRHAFGDSANKYIELLRSHIEKENKILFPLGDKRIPLAEQEKLLEAFEQFEEDVMGRGTHEKLHQLLHTFERRYLG